MSTYEALTFLHVASAIIWLGAGFLMLLLMLGAERAGDHEKAVNVHRDIGWLAPRLFIPASLSVFVFGVLLVIDGPWSFDQLWITIALGGWAASFFVGILYFKPEGELIGALAEERGATDAEVGRRLQRVSVVDRVQVLVLFTVVADMVLKPTGDDGVMLAIGGAVLLGASLAGLISFRRVA